MTARDLFSSAGFGVTHRFVRIVLGTFGIVAAYRHDLPLGLLGLPLIASGIVGWCPVCNAVEHTLLRWNRPLRCGGCEAPLAETPA